MELELLGADVMQQLAPNRRSRKNQFGDWEYVVQDIASGQKVYINRKTGEVSDDPPEEVLEIIERRKREKKRKRASDASGSDLNVLQKMVNITNAAFFSGGNSAAKSPILQQMSGHARKIPLPVFDFNHVDEMRKKCVCTNFAEFVSKNKAVIDTKKYEEYLEAAAFVIDDYLTAEECAFIIEVAENKGMRDVGYSPEVRVTDRVEIIDAEMAATLFQRAAPFLEEKILVQHTLKNERRISKNEGISPSGHAEAEIKDESSDYGSVPKGIRRDLKAGWWRPSKLNPMFRICRYTRGGHFSPHFDGGFDESNDMCSIKTFMIYLNGNDEYKGGSTQFFTEEQKHYEAPDDENVIYNYSPSGGSCMVFNHHLLHGGERIQSGTKYIMRTEVMYEYMGPVDMFDVSETPWAR